MPPTRPIAQLTVSIDAGDMPADELDGLTRSLRSELQELDVESAEVMGGGAVPPGAKSGEAVTLGALAVAVLPAMVPQLLEFLKGWSLRGEARTIKVKAQVGDRSLDLEYNPTVMSQAEVKTLVESLTSALAKPGDAPAAADQA